MDFLILNCQHGGRCLQWCYRLLYFIDLVRLVSFLWISRGYSSIVLVVFDDCTALFCWDWLMDSKVRKQKMGEFWSAHLALSTNFCHLHLAFMSWYRVSISTTSLSSISFSKWPPGVRFLAHLRRAYAITWHPSSVSRAHFVTAGAIDLKLCTYVPLRVRVTVWFLAWPPGGHNSWTNGWIISKFLS
jgi:hypothetical protein